MAKDTTEPEKTGRIQQFRQTYTLTKKTDPRIGLWLLGSFLLVGGLGFAVFEFLLPSNGLLGLVMAIVGGVLFGTLAALIIFGRRAQRSAYAQMEGQRGAAGAALRMLRRGWRTFEEPVAVTKQMDVVYRVVGPPGIVLIGEGSSPSRLRQLMIGERRKHERVVSDVPIHEVVCGNGEGEVPLSRLVRHVQKLGRDVKPAEMTDILNRLKALDANRSAIPMPKGPMPTSMKGLRGNLRGR
jgi:Domain of unknown function (DUF4191)